MSIISRIIKIISIILGSIIGAGFATGQEIYLFFGKYKIFGIIGIVISSLIISFVLYIVLKYINKYKIKSYDEYINKIFKGNRFLSYLNENIITMFLLFTFYIMELGFINLLFQQYGISKYIGMVIITILVYAVLIGNVKNVIKVNVFLVPILIIAMLYISITGIIKFNSTEVTLLTNVNNMFIIDAVLYASYNFIMLLPLLVSINDEKITKKEIKIISISIFIILVISSILILMLLSYFDISNIEIPIIYISNFINNESIILGAVLILLAIFTSIICVGYSFLNNVSKNKKKYKRNLLIMCGVGFLIINFSFASTMKITYTFLGALGFLQILLIILANFRKN